MRKFVVVVEVEVENGVNDSVGSAKNVQDYLNKVLSSSMGHQRDIGVPLKVKGVMAHKASRMVM